MGNTTTKEEPMSKLTHPNGLDKQIGIHFMRKFTKLQTVNSQIQKRYCLRNLKYSNTDDDQKDPDQLFKKNNINSKGLKKMKFKISTYFKKFTQKKLDLLFKQIGSHNDRLEELDLEISTKNYPTDQDFRTLPINIGKLKKLQHLKIHYPCKQITNEGLRCFAAQIGDNLRALKSLSLDFGLWNNFTDEGLIFFAKKLGKLKILERLELYLSSCQTSTGGALQMLVTQIGNNLKKLQSLILSFKHCLNIDNEEIKRLTTSIGKNCTELKYLELDFNGCEKITDKGIRDLAYEDKLRIFPSLNLNYLFFLMTAQKAKCLQNRTQILPNLQHLKLNLKSLQRITDIGIKELASQIGKNLHSLQTLSLILRSCDNITGEGIAEIPFQLTKLPIFNSLSLDFGSNEQLTDEGLKRIGEEISRNLSYLKSLEIICNWSNTITDKGFQSFISSLGDHLGNLQDLKIQFSHSKITDEGVQALASCIGSTWNKLQCLDLNFTDWRITDEGIEELACEIGRNQGTLHTLKLDFTGRRRLTGKGLKAIASQLGTKLRKLKNLAVIFFRNYGINDEAMIALVSKLDIKTLRHLNLNFDQCQELTDVSVEPLIIQLENLFNNRCDLEVYFDGLDNVSEGLGDILKKL